MHDVEAMVQGELELVAHPLDGEIEEFEIASQMAEKSARGIENEIEIEEARDVRDVQVQQYTR